MQRRHTDGCQSVCRRIPNPSGKGGTGLSPEVEETRLRTSDLMGVLWHKMALHMQKAKLAQRRTGSWVWKPQAT